MAYLFLFTGLILMALTFSRILAGRPPARRMAAPEDMGRPAEAPPVLAGMEERLEDLTMAVERLTEQLANHRQPAAEGFAEVLDGAEQRDLYRQIYAAYDTGQDVTELAREFQRGKGEVELILNLRDSGP